MRVGVQLEVGVQLVGPDHVRALACRATSLSEPPVQVRPVLREIHRWRFHALLPPLSAPQRRRRARPACSYVRRPVSCHAQHRSAAAMPCPVVFIICCDEVRIDVEDLLLRYPIPARAHLDLLS
eukprot:132394-Hanusia_phi.AAC.1